LGSQEAGAQAFTALQAFTGSHALAGAQALTGLQAFTGSHAFLAGSQHFGRQVRTLRQRFRKPHFGSQEAGAQALATGAQALTGAQAFLAGAQALTGAQALAGAQAFGSQLLARQNSGLWQRLTRHEAGAQALAGSQALAAGAQALATGAQALVAGAQAFTGAQAPPAIARVSVPKRAIPSTATPIAMLSKYERLIEVTSN
jgi:hypothetical protein